MEAAFTLTADGRNVTDHFRDNLIGLTLTDKQAMEADQLDIRVSDPEEHLALPRKGVTVGLQLGFKGSPLIDKGTYTVDEVEEGPGRFTIRARSADLRGNLKEEQEKAWDDVTIGNILTTLARKHDLSPAIEDSLARIHIEHLDQTNESDANLVTRLAKDYDALATVKSGHLLFMPVGHTKSVRGIRLPTRTINRGENDSHRFVDADGKGRYTGVKAKWQDTDNAKTRYEQVGEDGYVKTLRRTFPTKEQAYDAARAEWQKLNRNTATMTLDLAVGKPDLMPNMPITLSGWRDEISTIDWTVIELRHSLDGATNGLITNVHLVQR